MEKEWRVPTEHAAECVRGLETYGFSFSSEVLEQAGGSSTAATDDLTPELPFGEPSAHPAKTPSNGAAQGIRVAELNREVMRRLRVAFPDKLTVIGEVVGYDRAKTRRFLMFKLVDKPSPDRSPDAEVDVVLFPEVRTVVEDRLATAGVTLQDGMEILVTARVDFWEKAGRFRLVIDDIDPSYTLGNMQLSREQILRELREKGLDRLQPALAIPELPLRVGVLSSPDAEGYIDFLRTLQQGERGFRMTLHPTRVQGEQVEAQMLKGLKWFAGRAEDFDVLCIVRGGGSRTDLAWFDNARIAAAVATHPLPIVVGIGHERDRSVLDEIARSEKTPTAVAMYLRELVDAAEAHTDQQVERLHALVEHRLTTARDRLRRHGERVRHATQLRLFRERESLADAGAQVRWAAKGMLRDARGGLARTVTAIHAAVEHRMQRQRDQLGAAGERLLRSAPRRLRDADQQLRAFATRLRLLDPRQVIERGYAMVQDDAGKVITSANRLRPGDPFRVRLRDGDVDGRVEQVTPQPPQDAEASN